MKTRSSRPHMLSSFIGIRIRIKSSHSPLWALSSLHADHLHLFRSIRYSTLVKKRKKAKKELRVESFWLNRTTRCSLHTPLQIGASD